MATSVILPTTASLLIPTPTDVSPLSNSSGGDDGQSRSVSYFFGFLIAVIAFLVFFIGCSIGARRRLLRRRRLDVETGDAPLTATAFASYTSPPKEPLLWETTFEKGGGRWESIMVSIPYGLVDRASLYLLQPLSVAPATEAEEAPPPSYMPLSMPMPNWLRPRERIPSDSMLRWWIPSLPRIARRLPPETAGVPLNTVSQTASSHSPPPSSIPNPSPMSPVKKPVVNSSMTPSKPPDYQVVVMIAMPSQYPTKDGSLGDLQFGVIKLPVIRDSSEC